MYIYILVFIYLLIDLFIHLYRATHFWISCWNLVSVFFALHATTSRFIVNTCVAQRNFKPLRARNDYSLNSRAEMKGETHRIQGEFSSRESNYYTVPWRVLCLSQRQIAGRKLVNVPCKKDLRDKTANNSWDRIGLR